MIIVYRLSFRGSWWIQIHILGPLRNLFRTCMSNLPRFVPRQDALHLFKHVFSNPHYFNSTSLVTLDASQRFFFSFKSVWWLFPYLRGNLLSITRLTWFENPAKVYRAGKDWRQGRDEVWGEVVEKEEGRRKISHAGKTFFGVYFLIQEINSRSKIYLISKWIWAWKRDPGGKISVRRNRGMLLNNKPVQTFASNRGSISYITSYLPEPGQFPSSGEAPCLPLNMSPPSPEALKRGSIGVCGGYFSR